MQLRTAILANRVQNVTHSWTGKNKVDCYLTPGAKLHSNTCGVNCDLLTPIKNALD